MDVEFYRPITDDKKRSRPIATNSDRLNVEAQKIVGFLQENDRITRREAKEILTASDTKIKQIFNSLIAEKIIERKGSGRNIHYIRSLNYE